LIYAFEHYLLDVERRELRRGSDLVAVEPGVFDLLHYLICNRERVVSKDDLIAGVWNGRIVSESTLSGRINAARTAIGDTGEQQRLLRTFPRKGFRFVGEVREEHRLGSAANPAAPREAAAPSSVLLPDRPSIAVLPFANLSGNPEQEYFADGMVEDIITELSRFSELFVIARNSSFQYKGKAIDVRQAWRGLGVRYVLEGSIRGGGDLVRVSAQLLDAQTGAHRWAERYDRQIDNVFEVQDEIARTVAAILAAHVSKAEVERTVLKPPATWQAYDYYRRAEDAHAAFHRPMQVASIYKARRFLEQCLAIDPNFARAYDLQSRTQVSTWALPLDGDYMNPAVLDAAHRAAEKAVQLDPNLPQAHYQLGIVLSYKAHSQAAVAECERAVALNPN
jgi:TolB-like protein